ncbi:DNA-3-methyladenine glycosylase I [Halothiobacillus sp. DCM-1]|uniref:DNA-3-methyladenine glycosylase I n=1 Tax=Halothiobacillus sp. DCM-1 TaxID=3112558 RepID=UPI003252F4F5
MNPEAKTLSRCAWADPRKPDYLAYHDEEWGVPTVDDRRLFEFLLLETAQAGLSWYTILQKRAAYRAAFAQFDPVAVAAFDEATVAALLQNPGIVRHRKKIESALINARCFLAVAEEFGSFAHYLWSFVDGLPRQNDWPSHAACPSVTPESTALSRDLQRRGFRFVGPTVCYAYMQAVGLVNDHVHDCFRRLEVASLGQR